MTNSERNFQLVRSDDDEGSERNLSDGVLPNPNGRMTTLIDVARLDTF